MAEFNIPKHGEICWRELATKDLETALGFYSRLFGWILTQTKVTDMPYKEIQMNDVACGGMMAIDENWGPTPPPSHWSTYIAVDNADDRRKWRQHPRTSI
jgi:predicted enzyme related to lactoylglutathione lyase